MKIIYTKSFLIALLTGMSFAPKAQIINSIAGNGAYGYDGNAGPATDAELYYPDAVAVDTSGNVYISDSYNNVIRKVNTSGIISTIAGNSFNAGTGNGGYSGDNGPATDAELYGPTGIALDASGNLYIADNENYRIRKVNTSGKITTIAGNGVFDGAGDGGPATSAELDEPAGIAVDASGNIYIAQQYTTDSRVRKINTSGIINTVAGMGPGPGTDGFSGDGGPAITAELYGPLAVAVDASGNIYIADYENYRIRMVNTSGTINTIAGNGVSGYSGDGGPATSAEFGPTGVTSAGGNVYIADDEGEEIRMVNSSGVINTVAGGGSSLGDGGPATDAQLWEPTGVVLDASGNIYIADQNDELVRKVNSLTGINEISAAINQVNVYPVPNTGYFTVSGVTKGQILELYNYGGQKISSATADNSTIHFDITNNANGIYIMRILNKDGSVFTMKKILKTE